MEIEGSNPFARAKAGKRAIGTVHAMHLTSLCHLLECCYKWLRPGPRKGENKKSRQSMSLMAFLIPAKIFLSTVSICWSRRRVSIKRICEMIAVADFPPTFPTETWYRFCLGEVVSGTTIHTWRLSPFNINTAL